MHFFINFKGLSVAKICLKPESVWLSAVSEKSFIIEVRLGSKYFYEWTETFKMNLRLAESSRFLQRTAFRVIFYFDSKSKPAKIPST